MAAGTYLEVATTAVVVKPGELKRSAKGHPFTRHLCRVGDGDGASWLWLCVFGEQAEALAEQPVEAGSRLYAEGTLSATVYTRDGVPTPSLSVACRRVELLDRIGKRRVRRDAGDTRPRAPSYPNGSSRHVYAPY